MVVDAVDSMKTESSAKGSRVGLLSAIVKPLYESHPGNHSWKHVQSCLQNIDLIQNSQDGIDSKQTLFELAKLAILLHDLNRIGLEEQIPQIVKVIGLEEDEYKNVKIAITNHNKPKTQWNNPKHELSIIVYDADKMDTTRDRFATLKNVDNVQVPTTDKDYYGYVLMVRNSVTHKVAYDAISLQLPVELQINPEDPSVTAGEIKKYVTQLRDIWQVVNMPAKRTVAQQLLKATGNPNYTSEIIKSYPPISEETVNSLSPLRRRWFEYIKKLKTISNNFLSSIDKLAVVAEDPLDDRQKMTLAVVEKMFVYESFFQAIVHYPPEKEEDIELLMNRVTNSSRMHKNFEYAAHQISPKQNLLEKNELESRRKYFQNLIQPKIQDLCHYSPIRDIDSLIGGRRIMDKLINDLYDQYNETEITGLIDRAIQTNNHQIAKQLIRYYRQDSLRAVDRVNDSMRTDGFIYMLLNGQIIDAPVRHLPNIYRLNADELINHGLHYYAPTHPQAFHAIKMIRPFEEMPKIIEDAVSFFTQGMYLPDDFNRLYIDLFATLFDKTEIDPATFTFLFEHIIVNEESEVVRNEHGRFVTDGWLELDYFSRSDPRWQKANQALSLINTYCKNIGIIPFLRPYAVVDKDISVKQYARIELNSESVPI